ARTGLDAAGSYAADGYSGLRAVDRSGTPMKQERLLDIYEARLCPVCGYQLEFKPWDQGISSQEICPSCGIHFGYDDACGGQGLSARLALYLRWRSSWERNGARWWSRNPCPEGWDARTQLEHLAQMETTDPHD